MSAAGSAFSRTLCTYQNDPASQSLGAPGLSTGLEHHALSVCIIESAGVRGLRVLLPGAWERTLPSVSCPVLWGPCLRQLGHGVGRNQGSDEVLRPWFHQVRSLGQGFSNLAPQTLWDG